MYRHQTHLQVQLSHWREFQALYDELNALLQAKGLAPFELWEIAFGRFNEVLVVAGYATLEAYEREQHLLHADPAYLDLWRQMGTHLDGIPWTDLWWRPTEAV